MEIKQMKHGYALVFKCSGKWDAVSSNQFWDEFEHRLMDGEEIFIFDLTELDYLNARGTVSLLKAVKRLKSVSGSSAIVKGSGMLSEILEKTGVAQYTTVFDDLDAALDSFDDNSENDDSNE
ncbi:MAG: hypothetical protein CSB55_01555 [Candidatus Cloacimonadota bacterium]|nr:MAG: hypothetical protein CSB55_01555 [Candidatus Cloacimonadota bacterium]